MKNCKNTKDICPISKLCPSCDTFLKDFNKRNDNQERQQQARDQVHADNRNMNLSGSSFSATTPSSTNTVPTTSFTRPQVSSTLAGHSAPPPSFRPPAHNASNFPPVDGAIGGNIPPTINVNGLFDSYKQMKSTNTQPPILMDMFALMLNIHSKQSENDELRVEIKSNTTRLDSIEAKIGGIDDVSERLGLAVRRLPLPTTGQTDLDMVRIIFAEIKAAGIDVNRDITKAVRKLPAKPSYNSSQPILGTVLVEMKSEETRAQIMKNKASLENHPNETVRNVIIKNMKSKEQMFMENLGNSILKKIPGCENTFVTPNGQIRESTFHQRPSNSHTQPQYQPQQRPQQTQPQYSPYQTQIRAQLGAQQPQHHHHQQQPQFRPPPQFQFHPPQGYQTFQANPYFLPTNNQTPSNQAPNPIVSQPYLAPPSNQPQISQPYMAPPPNQPQVSQPYLTPPPNQPQVHDPYQSLLLQLDPLQVHHTAPATSAGHSLHLLQPAQPHYDYSEQEQNTHSDNSE